MLQHIHNVVQFPYFYFRPGMQKENEEFESLEEGHPLPVHWHVITLVLVQKSFTESDQLVEARQATGIIQWFWSDPEIVELDGSHPCPQERAKEQTQVFGGFCFTTGIKINKANFSLVQQDLRRAKCTMRGNQRIGVRARLQAIQSFHEGKGSRSQLRHRNRQLIDRFTHLLCIIFPAINRVQLYTGLVKLSQPPGGFVHSFCQFIESFRRS